MKHSLLFTICFLSAAACMSTLAMAQDKSKQEENTLIVSAAGEVNAAPDVAYVTLGVSTDGKTAQDAARANAVMAQKIKDALKQLGLTNQEIQTSSYNIYPRYDNRPGKEPAIIGYQVSNSVTATVCTLNQVGPIIDTALNAGANNVQGVRFSLQKKEPSENLALTEAVKAARMKANTLAAAANVRITGVQKIQENSNFNPMPVYGMMRSASVGAEVSTPISPGQLTISSSVTITYTIANKP